MSRRSAQEIREAVARDQLALASGEAPARETAYFWMGVAVGLAREADGGEAIGGLDLDPAETEDLARLVGEAEAAGGYLHVEVRKAVPCATETDARFCGECGADIDGNDPHGPGCSRDAEVV